MSQVATQQRGNVAAICSFACLGLQALWVVLCYAFAGQQGPETKGWGALLALLGMFVGVCALAAVGTAFGAAARHSGWGVLALTLNALAFLGTGIPLLIFFGPLR